MKRAKWWAVRWSTQSHKRFLFRTPPRTPPRAFAPLPNLSTRSVVAVRVAAIGRHGFCACRRTVRATARGTFAPHNCDSRPHFCDFEVVAGHRSARPRHQAPPNTLAGGSGIFILESGACDRRALPLNTAHHFAPPGRARARLLRRGCGFLAAAEAPTAVARVLWSGLWPQIAGKRPRTPPFLALLRPGLAPVFREFEALAGLQSTQLSEKAISPRRAGHLGFSSSESCPWGVHGVKKSDFAG